MLASSAKLNLLGIKTDGKKICGEPEGEQVVLLVIGYVACKKAEWNLVLYDILDGMAERFLEILEMQNAGGMPIECPEMRLEKL